MPLDAGETSTVEIEPVDVDMGSDVLPYISIVPRTITFTGPAALPQKITVTILPDAGAAPDALQ